MPRLVPVIPPHLASLDLAGRTLTAHWEALGQQLPEGPGVVAVDGRFVHLTAQTLCRLAQSLPAGATLLVDGAPVAVARAEGDGLEPVGGRAGVHPDQREKIDDAWSCAQASAALMIRRARTWIEAGVAVLDPQRVWIGPDVQLEPGCTLWPDVVLRGTTRVARGATVRERVSLDDCIIEEHAVIKPGTVGEGARVGPRSQVGPMAHLRPGTVLESDNKVGNFVETKKALLKAGAKASHLTYLGDAEIGEAANVGAGTITCNYDGFGKHRTVIGAGAFIGSNSALVAPVSVGDGAIVGAGSVVVKDVPDDCLTIARGVQRDFPGRASRINRRNEALAAKAKQEGR